MNKHTLIEYPCTFPIKIIGVNNPNFLNNVKNSVLHHFPDFKEEDMHKNISQKNNYLAITLAVYVENQTMLDALYASLTKIPDIKMVL